MGYWAPSAGDHQRGQVCCCRKAAAQAADRCGRGSVPGGHGQGLEEMRGLYRAYNRVMSGLNRAYIGSYMVYVGVS